MKKNSKKYQKTAKTSKTVEYVLGVDEVGRGPLAGPVTVCVSMIRKGPFEKLYEKRLKSELKRISGTAYPIGKDSKKMKENEREFWFEYLRVFEKLGDVSFFVGSKTAKQIDQKGIAVCIQELVDELVGWAYEKATDSAASVAEKNSNAQISLLADGGLKALRTLDKIHSQKIIIKGDEKEFAISIASVYAKVTRDRYMKKLSKNSKYSHYKFDIHKGYGTLAHRTVMIGQGLSDQHRKSFCKRFV